MNLKDLPSDRLATTDQKGNRIYLYPTDVKGRWNSRRSQISKILIALFLTLPWLRVNGHQAVLIDIPNRRFALFGLTFWAHDTPLLFFIIGGGIISIAFVTAVWGRVWCGWACPQTVFVEQIFRQVENWIEGDALRRKSLDQAPLSFQKVFKKSAKWTVFGILSLILSHSFLAYFVGTETLAQMISSSPYQNPETFLIMGGIAIAILFDFGWFREQFCTVVCPYGRFQSVLMDNQSTVVAYDMKRGEPRRGLAERSKEGDCVNCYRCVQVCPTGIDIRRGVQLECIACTACMDACDDVMSRLKRPLGLIRYGNQATTEGHSETSIPWFRRVRAWVYLGLWVVCGCGLALAISKRAPIELTLVREAAAPYQEILSSEGKLQIINHFKADLRNQTFESQAVNLILPLDLQEKGLKIILSNHKEILAPGEPERADLFIQFPKDFLAKRSLIIPIKLESKNPTSGALIQSITEAHLIGPLR